MTAPTFTNLTGSGASSATSFTTASVTPTANRLVLVVVHAYISTGSVQPATPTVTGNGMSGGYTLVQAWDVDTAGTDRGTIFLFRGMTASPSAGAITISFGAVSMTRCQWAVAQSDANVDTTGTNGSGAIVQSTGVTVASGTSASVNYVTAMTAGNSGFSCWGHQVQEAKTPRASWTELADVTTVTLASVETQYIAATDTAGSASWATSSRCGGIIAEIKAAGGATQNADGTATGTVTTAGAATSTKLVDGTASGSAGLTGTASATKPTSGATTATAAPAGTASTVKPVDGVTSTTASVSGAASASKPGGGLLSSSAIIVGAAAVVAAGITASGDLTATATWAGSASVMKLPAGDVAGTAILAGAAAVTQPAGGNVTAVATLTGALSVAHFAGGVLAVSAAVAGDIAAAGSYSPLLDPVVHVHANISAAAPRGNPTAISTHPNSSAASVRPNQAGAT